MELTPQLTHQNRKPTSQAIFLTLFVCIIAVGSLVLFVMNPPVPMVSYYRETMPQAQIENRSGNGICVQIPVAEPTVIFHLRDFLARQPAFICFDTNGEANDWMASMGLPH